MHALPESVDRPVGGLGGRRERPPGSTSKLRTFRDGWRILMTISNLMRNERLVVSRERLLDEVWGYDPLAATNTIDVFISNLRRKLEAADPGGATRRLIVAEPGVGYRVAASD